MKTLSARLIFPFLALTLLSFTAHADDDLTAIMNLAAGIVGNGTVSKVMKYNVKKYDQYTEQKTAIVDFLDYGGCANGGILPRADMDSNLTLLKRVTEDATGETKNPKSDASKMLRIVRT